jgi:hypothetical protein
MWAHRKIERADKLQYFKDKETEPSLTYTIWKERKMQAFELQEADKEFRKFKEREERAGKGRKSILGKASKQKAQKTGVKSLFSGPTASQSAAAAGQRGEEDEERLVGGEVGSGSQIKAPARSTTWGSDAPPAYSSIPTEDREHD